MASPSFSLTSSYPSFNVEQPFAAHLAPFSPYNFIKKAKTELKVALHPGVTQGLFNQILPHFNYLNPHIKIKATPYISLNKHFDLNLHNSNIFIGPCNPESLIKNSSYKIAMAAPLFTYTLRFFASKKYIEKPGRAEMLHNLTRHPILGVKYSDLLNKPDSWHLLPDSMKDHSTDLPVLMTIDHLSNFMLGQDGLAVVPWGFEGIFWSNVEMVPIFSGIRSVPIPVSFIALGDSNLKQETLSLYNMLKEVISHYQMAKEEV